MSTEMNMEPARDEGPVPSEPKMDRPSADYNMMENNVGDKMDISKLANDVNTEFDVIKYCYEQKLFTYQHGGGFADHWNRPKLPTAPSVDQGASGGTPAESWNRGESGYGQTSEQSYNDVHKNEAFNTEKPGDNNIPQYPMLFDERGQPSSKDGADELAPPDMLSCGICGKQFTQTISLTIHMRGHTGEKPFECETCGQRFADNLILKSHKRTHIGERPYICTKCGKCFSQKSTLIAHEKVHTGEQLHACQFCGREFLEQSSLTKHARMHENNAMYNIMKNMQEKNRAASQTSPVSQSAGEDFDVVKYCYEQNLVPVLKPGEGGPTVGPNLAEPRIRSKPVEDDAKKDSDRFEKKWKKLKPENKRHANDGAEKNSEFIDHWNKQLTDMNSQVNDDSNKDYDIPKPPTGEESDMDKSMEDEHEKESAEPEHFNKEKPDDSSQQHDVGEEEEEAPGSYDSSSIISNLYRNSGLSLQHLRPFRCELCDKRFAQKMSLTVHMKSHAVTGEKPFECDICGRRFTDSLILKAHENTHTGERPFVCTTCGKCFSQRSTLSVHQKVHTGEGLYTCEFCGKDFLKKYNLNKHLKVHTGDKAVKGSPKPKANSQPKPGPQPGPQGLGLGNDKGNENSINTSNNVQNRPEVPEKMDTNELEKMNTSKPPEEEFDLIKYCYEQKLFPYETGAGPGQAGTDATNKPDAEKPWLKALAKKLKPETDKPVNGDTNNKAGVNENDNEKPLPNDKPMDYAASKSVSKSEAEGKNSDNLRKEGGNEKFDVKDAFAGSYDSLGRFSHIYGSSGVGGGGLPLLHPGKVYRCEMCDERFAQQFQLTIHMQGHAGERPLECDICGERFADKLILRSHKRVHAARKPFMCTLCGEGFSQWAEFNVHQMTHMNEHYASQYGGQSNNGGLKTAFGKSINADDNGGKGSEKNQDSDKGKSDTDKPADGENPVMNKSGFYPGTYGRPGTLAYNAGKISKPEVNPLFPDIARPFKCEICDRRFAQKISLTVHLRGHTGEKPFECETCGKRFADNLILKAHKRTHTGERPFVCMTCGKGFSQRSTLSVHLKSHTGEKLHACEYCGKEFSKKSALTKHLRIHTGEKPYECHVCKRLFTQDYSLTVHLRLHSGEKPFQCHICEKKFTTNTNLRRHMVVHKDVLGTTGTDGSPLGKPGSPGSAGSGKVGSGLQLDKTPVGKVGTGILGRDLMAGIPAPDFGTGGPGLDLRAGMSGPDIKSGGSGPDGDSRPDFKDGESGSDFKAGRPGPDGDSRPDFKKGESGPDFKDRESGKDFEMRESGQDFKARGSGQDFKAVGFGSDFKTEGSSSNLGAERTGPSFGVGGPVFPNFGAGRPGPNYGAGIHIPGPDFWAGRFSSYFGAGGPGSDLGAGGHGLNLSTDRNPFRQVGSEGSSSEAQMNQSPAEKERSEMDLSAYQNPPEVIVKVEQNLD